MGKHGRGRPIDQPEPEDLSRAKQRARWSLEALREARIGNIAEVLGCTHADDARYIQAFLEGTLKFDATCPLVRQLAHLENVDVEELKKMPEVSPPDVPRRPWPPTESVRSATPLVARLPVPQVECLQPAQWCPGYFSPFPPFYLPQPAFSPFAPFGLPPPPAWMLQPGVVAPGLPLQQALLLPAAAAPLMPPYAVTATWPSRASVGAPGLPSQGLPALRPDSLTPSSLLKAAVQQLLDDVVPKLRQTCRPLVTADSLKSFFEFSIAGNEVAAIGPNLRGKVRKCVEDCASKLTGCDAANDDDDRAKFADAFGGNREISTTEPFYETAAYENRRRLLKYVSEELGFASWTRAKWALTSYHHRANAMPADCARLPSHLNRDVGFSSVSLDLAEAFEKGGMESYMASLFLQGREGNTKFTNAPVATLRKMLESGISLDDNTTIANTRNGVNRNNHHAAPGL